MIETLGIGTNMMRKGKKRKIERRNSWRGRIERGSKRIRKEVGERVEIWT